MCDDAVKESIASSLSQQQVQQCLAFNCHFGRSGQTNRTYNSCHSCLPTTHLSRQSDGGSAQRGKGTENLFYIFCQIRRLLVFLMQMVAWRSRCSSSAARPPPLSQLNSHCRRVSPLCPCMVICCTLQPAAVCELWCHGNKNCFQSASEAGELHDLMMYHLALQGLVKHWRSSYPAWSFSTEPSSSPGMGLACLSSHQYASCPCRSTVWSEKSWRTTARLMVRTLQEFVAHTCASTSN